MSAGIEKKLADLLDSVDRKKRRADIEKYLIEHEHALYEAERMPFIGGVTITPCDSSYLVTNRFDREFS